MRRPAPRSLALASMRAALLAIAAACLLPAPIAAQRSDIPQNARQAAERIRQEQRELERLRNERNTLERRMQELQSSARDVAAERQNLERQALATARLVRSLDAQLGTLYEQLNAVNEGLVRTQDELAVKRATVRHRVNEIYKRGPLYTLEALLSAESFASLVARYKYLHLVAKRDHSLLDRVEALNAQIVAQRALLVRLQGDVEQNRREKADEESRLRRLELQRGRTLASLEQQQRRARERLDEIARDESRLTNVIAALEEARRRAEAAASARGATAPTTGRGLTTADLGRLDWPVEGDIVYRFGRVRNPNNTSFTWNGMGIGAPIGTPVKVIADGEVVTAEQLGTYGFMVIVQHGAGAYSLYGSLAEIRAPRGTKVKKGDIIGTVGQSDPDIPPRLHFEIRPEGQRPVDPLDYLRRQR
ncbi:MAG: peptidoglycan DD-metalloendopeptidase family protein [Gemmatimonadaceae bacterium]|nr:peptidoglycan DD-metalloendopeptidase family protein [Gemmatimonadaceae bacterium]